MVQDTKKLVQTSQSDGVIQFPLVPDSTSEKSNEENDFDVRVNEDDTGYDTTNDFKGK